MNRRERLAAARLYFIGDASAPVDAALRGGADLFQLRDKELDADELLRVAVPLRELCHEHGALFIVNDHPGVAAAADADGVHVGQDDISVLDALEIVGRDRLVGLSTHTPAQIDRATIADYIGVGPVHATPTKAGRPAAGLDLVRYAAAHARVPWFAIGGLDETTLPDAVAAGATRASVVRAIGEAANPEEAARRLRAVITDGSARA